ncbi:hypothetical protein B0H66DRAFT_643947 [Apodospora peruviana]|uniref:Uncharacterized protein n=1 Tax=Apodospora peruviana TaxID=516989 RepID=A0AAE0LYV7_9PEZI|nr:hypothetical protein B0H66DRAFT_643947 [Apodospora peruviana]
MDKLGGPIEVDLNGDPIGQPVGNWLARVSNPLKPPAPRIVPYIAPHPPMTVNGTMPKPSTTITTMAKKTGTPDASEISTMAAMTKVMERLNKKINDMEHQVYELKEQNLEVLEKKQQFMEQAAAHSNTRSSVKTINTRLNNIEYGCSAILDRIENIERAISANLNEAFVAPGGGDGNLPTSMTATGSVRSRKKRKRMALAAGQNGMSVPSLGGGREDIEKVEELLGKVVRELALMKMQNGSEFDMESIGIAEDADGDQTNAGAPVYDKLEDEAPDTKMAVNGEEEKQQQLIKADDSEPQL